MIFLSSFKPNVPFNSEYHKNQRFAFESLHEVTQNIVYLNDYEEYLSSEYTLFLPHENYPRIWEMAEILSYQSDWGCIINSDIVIAQYGFNKAMEVLKRKGAKASSSWRWTFDPARGLWPNKVVDPGMDYFACTPEIWRHIARIAPDNIRIGCQRWDSWMLGALNVICPKQFFAVTNYRFLFHPKHEGRKYGGDIGPLKEIGQAAWPLEI